MAADPTRMTANLTRMTANPARMAADLAHMTANPARMAADLARVPTTQQRRDRWPRPRHRLRPGAGCTPEEGKWMAAELRHDLQNLQTTNGAP